MADNISPFSFEDYTNALKDLSTTNDPSITKDVLNKLGLTNQDYKDYLKSSRDLSTEGNLNKKNEILKKIENSWYEKEVASNQGVTNVERGLIQNFISDNLPLQQDYLTKKGYDSKIVKNPEGVNKLVVLDKKTGKWGVVDPKGFDLMDIVDVAGDTIQGVLSTGGITAMLAETGKQGLSQKLGMTKEGDLKSIGTAAVVGAIVPRAIDWAGKSIKIGLQETGNALKGIAYPKPNPDALAISTAKKSLGIKGELPSDYVQNNTISNIESELAQGPYLASGKYRGAINERLGTLQDSVNVMVDKATPLTQNEFNKRLGVSLSNELEAKLGPIEAVYDEAQKILPDIKVNKNVITNKISELLKSKSGDPAAKNALEYSKNYINENVKNLNDLKLYRTSIGKWASTEQNANVKSSLYEIYDALTLARSQSIKDTAGKTLSKQDSSKLITELEKTDTAYGGISKDIKTIFSMNKNVKGTPRSITEDQFSNLDSKKYGTNAISSQNVESIIRLKNEFPESFDIYRTGILKEITDQSTSKEMQNFGDINVKKFFQTLDKYPQEVKILILGEDSTQKIEALKTMLKSLPKNVNPSGTAITMNLQNIWNPINQLFAMGRYIATENVQKNATGKQGLASIIDKGTMNAMGNAMTGLSKIIPVDKSAIPVKAAGYISTKGFVDKNINKNKE